MPATSHTLRGYQVKTYIKNKNLQLLHVNLTRLTDGRRDPKATRNQVGSGRIEAAGAWWVGVGGRGGGRGNRDALLCPGTVIESAVLKQ